jgi:hypothetical protein
MTAACLNLLERFGDRFQIGWDQACDPGHVPADRRDPWMMEVRCRFGITIYPFGGSRLAVEVNGHRNIARQLRDLPGATLHQDGDGEQTFVFDLAEFDRVAEIVKPHRRRLWTEDERRAVGKRLAPFQFVPVVDPGHPDPGTAATPADG